MNSNTSKFDIFKSFFVRDKDAFWRKHFSDYELELSRMTISELASELERTKIRNETANTIIIEHIIAIRLVRVQNKTSWQIALVGFVVSILIAILSYYLGKASTC